MRATRGTTSRPALQWGARVAALTLFGGLLAACGSSSSSSGEPTLSWYINPNSSGSLQQIANACQKQANGEYKISIQVLPATADGQREQIVRRLAASDPSIDVVSVDPPYVPELANAGWLSAFTEQQRTELLQNVLKAPIETSVWQGRLIAAPFIANTQLLWYKKSVAKAAGVDPTSPSFTWDQMIDGAVKAHTIISEQGMKYEGYMVWVNAMVLGAGGQILTNNDRGRNATVAIDSPAGSRAATIIHKLANSSAADPSLSTADEALGLATFETDRGGFMLNWPYVYAAFQASIKAGSLKASFMDDLAWARYPRVDADKPSKPPLGGINVAISKFSAHQKQDYDLVKCIISPPQEKIQFLVNGDPVANSTVYDDPSVRKVVPMADLIRDSINEGGPRPITPFYGDVSGSIQRTWHPPASANPVTTPPKSADLITAVLHDRRLL